MGYIGAYMAVIMCIWWSLVVCALLGCCAAADQLQAPWWSNAVYYRVLVDSFKDGNGDGLGDLIGATKQLSYVRALGADAVILSPIMSRSTDCSKPGVMDFTEMDPRYGSLESLVNLLEKAKQLELKVVITLPLQMISQGSEWFGASANRSLGHEDWVLWREGKPDEAPETEAAHSWTWHPERASYWASSSYSKPFFRSEALLNLCSEGLTAALAAAQCAWLRRGAGGVLLEPDYPLDQSCAEKLVTKLAADALACARASNLDMPVILVESTQTPEAASRYYADSLVGAHSVISNTMTSDVRTSADMAISIHRDMLLAPTDMMPTWSTSQTNESRLATRYGNEMVDSINLMTLILPGSAIIHQGDELGAADSILEWAADDKCWPNIPSPASAPFAWDTTANAGFSSAEPWLPLAPNYRYANAKTQFSSEGSHADVVRVAAAMRKSPAVGPHVEITRLGQALAILRWGGAGTLLGIANIDRNQADIRPSKIPGLPSEMTVATSSAGSSMAPGYHMVLDRMVKLAPGEAVLLAGAPRHCGGPGPVDKITSKLSEGWSKINKYFEG